MGEDIEGPARVTLHIPRIPGEGRSSQNWVLAEGWWAARLAAPSFLTMLGWSRRVMWRVFLHLVWYSETAHRVVTNKAPKTQPVEWSRTGLAKMIEWISGRFLTLSYIAVLLLLTPFTFLLFLIAKLPIPGLEEFILLKMVRPLLLDGVGDFYTYLYDEAQALHMRRSIQEAVTWLVDHEHCERVVVVAHSGGVVLAYDALGTRRKEACVHDTKALRKVAGLVTFGAALNNAWLPGVGPQPPLRLQDPLCDHTKWIDMWAAFDYVAGGPIEKPNPTPDESIKVTNELSAARDHGGYFENEEEHLPRLAQFIESPADRHASRFWKAMRAEWIKRRQDRTTTLVAWRQWAYAVFGIALFTRRDLLETDGLAMVHAIRGVPLLGDFTDSLGKLMDSAPELVKPAAAIGTGLAGWFIVGLVLQLAVVAVVFEAWASRDGRRSIKPLAAPTGQKLGIGIRTFLVFAALTVLALGVATFGRQFQPTLVEGLAVIVEFLLWWAFWWLVNRALAARTGDNLSSTDSDV